MNSQYSVLQTGGGEVGTNVDSPAGGGGGSGVYKRTTVEIPLDVLRKVNETLEFYAKFDPDHTGGLYCEVFYDEEMNEHFILDEGQKAKDSAFALKPYLKEE